MKPPKVFYRYGYTFELRKQRGNMAVYAQKKNGRVYAYELHIMRPNRLLPRSKSEFGTYAWTYPSVITAINAMNRLIEEREGKQTTLKGDK